jgi:hypothetical protein
MLPCRLPVPPAGSACDQGAVRHFRVATNLARQSSPAVRPSRYLKTWVAEECLHGAGGLWFENSPPAQSASPEALDERARGATIPPSTFGRQWR